MIEIVIPTLKRLSKQITLSNIPDEHKRFATLVVQPQEENEAKKIHDRVFVLSGNDIGFAKTIKEITYEWSVNRASKFWILDDDLSFMYNDLTDDGWKKSKLSDQQFASMIGETEEWISQGILHGGIGTTWEPPSPSKYPFNTNCRIMTNKFYNGLVLAEYWKEIDWDGCCGAEDFYVNLQLLTRGFENRVWFKYVVSPSDTNADGGCSTYRDVAYHNNAMETLKTKFPEFVTLKEKVQTTGPWKGQSKLAATIMWKRAYESSQKSSLEGFFNG